MLILLIVVLAALLLAATVYAVTTFDPVFGAHAYRDAGHRLHRSLHFREGKFRNLIPTSMVSSTADKLSMLRDFVKRRPNARPAPGRVPVVQLDTAQLGGRPDQLRVTWLGHSAALLEIGGRVLLLDPMLGRAPSPFPRFGGKRYADSAPFEIAALPPIDAVIFSHDHYDHLDYGTIRTLHPKVGRFIVPLGVGAHLRRWGVDEERIEEHDWYETFDWAGFRLACMPARHFSGRGLTGRDATLWCSWIIEGGGHKVFFSGDSGYGPHFADIGERFGPFDLTLVECGQYDPRWAAIHMTPEETVQAHIDVRGAVLLPIHWGAFTLALHDWNDPIRRASAEAAKRGVRLIAPRIGETVTVDEAEPGASPAWWSDI
ncbi:MBL fold metallo-hydrolase [Cohnella sp. 56]|uniref:MBL fold metallo-hydrolase n=1 Tax=Cohnella sp. 56 TaxID=3113722 RepID=UPI0030E85BB6